MSAKLLSEHEILSTCACHKTRMAMRSVTRAYDEALRPLGLRATQLLLLVAIAAEGAMSISALADTIGMDRSTLTRNVQPLEEEGLIQRGGEGWRRTAERAIRSRPPCGSPVTCPIRTIVGDDNVASQRDLKRCRETKSLNGADDWKVQPSSRMQIGIA